MWQSNFQFVTQSPLGDSWWHHVLVMLSPHCRNCFLTSLDLDQRFVLGMRVVLGDVLDGVVGAVAKGRPPSHCSSIPLTQLVDFRQVYTMRIWGEIYQILLPFIFRSILPMIYVLTVGARMRKLFETFFALVGFLATVQPLMLHQMMFVFECFVTTITLMRSMI